MLLAKKYANLILFANFLLFLLFEIICFAFLELYYLIVIELIKDESHTSIENSTKELLTGFNQAIGKKINSFRETTLFVAKELEIYSKMDPENSLYKGFSNRECIISQEDLNVDDFYINLEDKERISKSIYDYIKSQSQPEESEQEDKVEKLDEDAFMKTALDIDYLNKISSLSKPDYKNETYDKLACTSLPMMKSILLHRMLLDKNYNGLDQFFMLYGHSFYIYPATSLSLTELSKFADYSDSFESLTQCQFEYDNACMGSLYLYVLNYIYLTTDYTNPGEHVALFSTDSKLIMVTSCVIVNIEPELSTTTGLPIINFICSHNYVDKLMDEFNLKDLENFDMVSLYLTTMYGTRIMYSLHHNLTEFPILFGDERLGEYRFTEQANLYHVLYYNIFKYKQHILDDELIDDLEEDFQKVEQMILDVTESFLNGENTYEYFTTMENYFLEPIYNKKGNLDYENGNIVKGEIFFYFQTIKDPNIRYNEFYIQNGTIGEEKNVMFNLAIYKFCVRIF